MQPQQPLNQQPPEQTPVPEPPFTPAPPPLSSVVPTMPPAQQYPPTPAAQANYDFIMNSNRSRKNSVIASGSMTSRIIVALVGLIVLVILFIAVKGLLSGGQPIDVPAMTIVTEDQQEIVHLLYIASAATPQQVLLPTTTQDFIVTGQLSVKDQQGLLLAYLKANGHNISTKQLSFRVSSRVDKEITGSVAANTYAQTFTQVMQSDLATYQRDLTVAYQNTKTTKGRTLLKDDYTSAQLLLDQLNSSATT